MLILNAREQVVLERVVEDSTKPGYPSGFTKATIRDLEYKQLVEKVPIKNMRRYFVTPLGMATYHFNLNRLQTKTR